MCIVVKIGFNLVMAFNPFWTVLGISCVKTSFNLSQGITVEYVDPASIVYSYTDDPNFQDLWYVGEVKNLTIPEVKKKFPNLTQEEVSTLEKYQGNQEYLRDWNGRYDDNTVQVLFFEYKTFVDQVFKIKEGPNGLEKALENATASGNEGMIAILQDKIANFKIEPATAKAVSDVDLAKAYIDTIHSARPVANFFGGDIMEPLFNWLYFTVDWNVNNYGNQFADGLYSCLMIWFLLALICYVLLSQTQAGNWIYSTGGNLNAAKANGVPTNKVKISLFMFSAFCATMFAACQVFETNTADTAKGNLKELEAIAAAVIGGVVLTGGFGTVVGIIVGAAIFGIAKEAFFYIPGVDGSFYRVFLGIVLLASALTNENIRKRVIGSV